MNKQKITKFFVGPKDPNRTRYETDGAISLLDPHGFKIFLKKHAWRIISLCLRRRGESISTTIRMYHNFGQYLMKLNKHHGSVFVVKYLKASQLALQKKIAGQPLDSLRELEPDLPLPRLSKSGIPAIIGLRHRRAIYSGSLVIVRLWLTLFSLYRVIRVPCKGKLNTITDPFTGDISFISVIGEWMERHVPRLLADKFDKRSIGGAHVLPLEKASPSNSFSWGGLLTDAIAIGNSSVSHAFKTYCLETGNDDLWYRLSNLCSLIKDKSLYRGLPIKESLEEIQPSLDEGSISSLPIGQLAFKEEAAGKLRVFAMVDIWTQSVMRPLHDSLFRMLSSLPNDGTFDQEASFERCVQKAAKAGCAFGYDLSAATDRLPISTQVAILSSLIGRVAAESWKEILVGRPYRLPLSSDKYGYPKGTNLYYAVGQPMGALSSWAMLATTHHLIVQYCNWSIRPTTSSWFDQYEVLGDDIQIFDSEVAAKYLEVCESLGVSINLSKSVVSEQLIPVVEYAKRTSMKGADVSALSWKMIASQDNAPGRVMVGMKVWEKGIFKNLLQALRFATAKTKFRLPRGSASYAIISFYTSLYKKGLVDWRWLLERLATKDGLSIHYGSGKLPPVSEKEFEEVLRIIASGGDLSDFEADFQREFLVEARYINQTEFVLRQQILRLQKLLSSREFVSRVIPAFAMQLYRFDGSRKDPRVLVALDDLIGEMVTLLKEDLPRLLRQDLSLRKLGWLVDYLDQLESIRRKLEIGFAPGSEHKVAISSDLYVLKKLGRISNLKKAKKSQIKARAIDAMNNRKEVLLQSIEEYFAWDFESRYDDL